MIFFRNCSYFYELRTNIIAMNIKILGAGCARCKSLEHITRKAVEELGFNAEIEKVEDFRKIMEYGVMQTPGLVVNDKTVLTGRVPKLEEIKTLLESCR